MTRPCVPFARLAHEMADGIAAPADAAAFAAHAAGCVGCRDAVSAWRDLGAVLRATPWVDPPADLADRVVATLADEAVRRRAAAWRAAAAGIAGVAAGGLLLADPMGAGGAWAAAVERAGTVLPAPGAPLDALSPALGDRVSATLDRAETLVAQGADHAAAGVEALPAPGPLLAAAVLVALVAANGLAARWLVRRA